MIPSQLVDGMIGNITRAKRHWAAKITSTFGRNGRIHVALYSSHSDRMLFGDKALVRTITTTPDKFRPCDSSVQPPDVMVRVVEKRIASEVAARQEIAGETPGVIVPPYDPTGRT